MIELIIVGVIVIPLYVWIVYDELQWRHYLDDVERRMREREQEPVS